jgi:transmembrane sensor
VKRDQGFDADASEEERIAAQAAQWVVQLSADDEAARITAQRDFDAWKTADPRHAAMAARVEGFIGRVQNLRGADGNRHQPARAALNATFTLQQKRSNRIKQIRQVKRIGAVVAIALALGLPAWIAVKAFPPAYLAADMRTVTGKWETRVLADGSSITLNSASAVNLHFDAARRTLELVQGEILVDVAKDPGRPFVVETTHGSVRALGTRFVVSREADATVLNMLESRVAVRTAQQDPDHPTIVTAGQRLRFTAERIGTIEDIDARSIADAWKFHQLVVRNQSLPEVLDALDRYRPGAISYNREQIAGINVSAVLPLDDTGRALQLLANSFPALRIRTFSPYLVRVDAPEAP